VVEKGIGKIGRIAVTGEPLIARGIRGDEDWLANPNWIARQSVRSFIGLPLIAKGTIGGVLAVFDREVTPDAVLDDLEFVADFTAVRLRDLQDRGAHAQTPAPAAILTRADLRTLEKRSIQAALDRTKGKVFGADGAARLLQMKPTTLLSRIKALASTSST
jgi:transcriptional regulator with GAF, ATPase, and Fis domain